MKKRTIAIIMILAMVLTLFTGCAKTAPDPEPTEPIEIIDYEKVEVTVEPIMPTPIPEPETITGICLANDLKVRYEVLNRGDKVSIVGEDGDFYLIEYGEDFRGDPATLLVEKKYIRSDEANVEARTVYCVGNAPVYSSAVCGEDQLLLNAIENAEVTVIDEMNGIVYIEWTETTEENGTVTRHGYMLSSDVSDTYITAPVWYGGGGGGGNGGGGGGGGSDAGYDGGDIAAGDLLGARIPGGGMCGPTVFLAPLKHTTVRRVMTDVEKAEPAADEVTEGVCFSDEVPVYAGVLNYGDEVKVIAEREDTSAPHMMFTYGVDENGSLTYEEIPVYEVRVLLNGCICDVLECVFRMPEDEPFEAWDGYIQNDVSGYSNYDLSDDGIDLPVNSLVTVEDEILGVLIIKDGDNVYYVTPDCIKTEEYVAPVNYGWYGGGGGGGGGGGEVVESWTPPAL